MSYLALCTFDLKGATAENYKNAYSDLEKIGLKKVVVSSSGGSVVIPTTTAMGTFDGQSAGGVRDYVKDKVKKAFTERGLSFEVFFVVGGDWAWGA